MSDFQLLSKSIYSLKMRRWPKSSSWRKKNKPYFARQSKSNPHTLSGTLGRAMGKSKDSLSSPPPVLPIQIYLLCAGFQSMKRKFVFLKCKPTKSIFFMSSKKIVKNGNFQKFMGILMISGKIVAPNLEVLHVCGFRIQLFSKF